MVALLFEFRKMSKNFQKSRCFFGWVSHTTKKVCLPTPVCFDHHTIYRVVKTTRKAPKGVGLGGSKIP